MSVIRLLTTAVTLIAFAAAVPAQVQVLSQSVDSLTITPGNTVACTVPGPPQLHRDASTWRAYPLFASGVVRPLDILSITFGVQVAISLAGTGQPLELRLWADPTGTFASGAPVPGQLVPLHAETFNQPDVLYTAPTLVTHVLSGPVRIMPFETLVVEIHQPDGIPSGSLLFLGSNPNGETAPSWYSSSACGIPGPRTYPSLGFSGVHVIIDVNVVPVPLQISFSLLGTGGGLLIDNSGLVPGVAYWNVFSLEPAPGGPGTGPIFGLYTTNLQFLIDQVLMPPHALPFRFVAPTPGITHGPYPVPSGVTIEALTFDFGPAGIVSVSPVGTISIP